jgi:hypothetical protein
VLAARELEPTVAALRAGYGLGEPYRDPLVGHFGLVNAVFCIGDTFLEVVSPVDRDVPGARTAARQLERSGAAVCGYMAMIQVEDIASARERARQAGVREVFELELADIVEVHLHPGDMRGAIVALSEPRPAAAWRWGGADWPQRSVPGAVCGLEVAAADPETVRARWEDLAGAEVPGCRFVADREFEGITGIELSLSGARRTLRPAHL